MRSVFWNSTTAEDETPGSTFKLQALHQLTFPKALCVPAGVMWQSEAPLNPGRHTLCPPAEGKTSQNSEHSSKKPPAFWL
jgi:hypothetical protein